MIFYMPNRMFYRQLEGWDTPQLEHKLGNMFAYASLELLSFLALALLLRRQLHLSTLHQLAFVLDKQWAGVQSRLLVWVMFLIQGSVEHYGSSLCCYRCVWLDWADTRLVFFQASTRRSSFRG